MSKFIEKLEKVGQSAPVPMGFGAARQEAPVPQIMLIGQVSADDVSASYVAPKVDAVLVSLGAAGYGALDAIAESLKSVVWGIRVGVIDETQVAVLKEKGCDFIVFDAENTSAGILNDDDLGKIIAINSELDEDTARAIHELDIDAAMFSHEIELSSLTVQKVFDIQAVRGLIGKPFVMTCAVELDRSALETMRNAEINGLVIATSATDAIDHMRDAIKNLPRRKNRTRTGDYVPHISVGFRPPAEDYEYDDDDGDDDDY